MSDTGRTVGLSGHPRVELKDAVAGRTYWLTLGWDDEGTWREPMYSGRILNYDAFSVTVEIDVQRGVSRVAHPRRNLVIQELPGS